MRSDQMERLGVASFFAGIGGFDLGLEKAGFEVRYQSEIDEFCNSVLQRHWPNVERVGDIREVKDGNSIPRQEIWCAGFPCQDVSVARAGSRQGLSGPNSSLFFEFLRLLGDGCPTVVVLENVPGLLSSNGGRDFGIVVNALGKLGYSVAWRILDSRFFGVPQSRRRLYVVGHRGDPSKVAEILFESECGPRHPEKGDIPRQKSVSPFKEVLGGVGGGPIVPRLAYCLSATSGRHTGTDWSRTYVVYPDAVRRITPLEAERLQGFPDNWTMPCSELDDGPDVELLDSHRYAALGNAVTVNVAEWLGYRLQSVLKSRDASEGSQPVAKAHQRALDCYVQARTGHEQHLNLTGR